MDSGKVHDLKATFQQDGFLFLPAFFSDKQVEEMNKELTKFIAEVVPGLPSNKVIYEEKDNPETLKQLQDLELHNAFFNELMVNSEIEKLAAALLNEKVIGKNVEYFNKPPRIGKFTPPHQDAYYFNIKPRQAVTVWIALENIDEENGYVSYVAGSHTKGMRPHGRTQTIGFSQSITDYGTPEDEANVIACPANPGDVLIHHCMTIHSANANTSSFRSRKALGLIYFGASAQPDLEAREAYATALKAQLATV